VTFDESLAILATVTDADLQRDAWTFRGRPSDLGYALYHAAEDEQRAVVTTPRAPTESARILALAQSAFGDLRGLLAGLDEALLDRAPAAGEWSVRETLVHAIGTERSYRAATLYGIARTAAEPVLMPAERRPPLDSLDTAGGPLDIVARFAARRAETDATLSAVADADLARPIVWSGVEVDVRHRLHRFASHIAEHAYQCEKAMRALGAYGGDARTICRRIGALRGLHERWSDAKTLRALDAALAEKARIATRG
jgi:hypothetical protein